MADQKGGETFFNIDSPSNYLGKILDNNWFYYRLSYAAPQIRDPQAYQTIILAVKNHPECRVRTQNGYVPPDPKMTE